jgi:hypothetical protein
MKSAAFLVAALLCLCAIGCGRKEGSAPTSTAREAGSTQLFQRITDQSGVQFIHRAGTNYAMPEQIGSGIALLDYDRDGILDLYLVQNATSNNAASNKLYHGIGGGKLEDVSQGSGVDVLGRGMSAIAGDLNNDGWPDLVVAEYGVTRVFVNLSGKSFKEVTRSCGVDNPRWGVAASFIDFDRDGRLDLVVGNYVDYDPSQICKQANGQQDFCAPSSFPPTVSRLWRNVTLQKGGEPIFEDWTVQSGIGRVAGMALGVVCADFNGDHWPDIFFADDGRPNRLFINQHNGVFTEEAAARGLAYDAMGRTAANMGVVFADLNLDGWPDLFVTHLAEEFHSFFRQQEPGVFLDSVAQSGLQQQGWRGTGFGAVAADFNLDGWPDLAIANGLIRRGPGAQKPVAPGVQTWWGDYAQRQQIFLNDHGTFKDVSNSNPEFCGEASVARSLAVGDLDNDGAPDLVLANVDGPVEIFRNIATARGHWLKIRLLEPEFGSRDAIGSEIRIAAGGQVFWGLLQPATSYAVSHEPVVHFGLGDSTKIESVEVIWANGEVERFAIDGVDRAVAFKRGEGEKK